MEGSNVGSKRVDANACITNSVCLFVVTPPLRLAAANSSPRQEKTAWPHIAFITPLTALFGFIERF